MQLTLATITQSRRSNNDRVAESRSLSSSSIDGGFFFDVDVARRNVSFGLIIIVIADEIFHGVRREKRLEFLIKLRGQRLVMRQHQRRTAGVLDHLRHGERFAGAGDAQQNLVLLALLQAVEQRRDGGRLIAARLIVDAEPEGHLFIIRSARDGVSDSRKCIDTSAP